MIIVYKYNNDGYFIGDHQCQLGIEGETLFPSGNYTELKPNFEENKIPKFVDRAWINIIDNRGKIYYVKETREKIIWGEIEDYIGDEFTEIEPPSPFYKWDVSDWIEDVSRYFEYKISDARNLATTKWIDSTKAITAIQQNYNVFKNGNYNSFAEVDAAFNDFEQFMDL